MKHTQKKEGRYVFLPHHRYQLDVILLFSSGVFLLIPYLYLLEEYQLSIITWQWAFFIPFMLLYISYSLLLRSRIDHSEYVPPLKRTLIPWILLGTTIISWWYVSPPRLTMPMALPIAFVIASIFVVDAYYDFW